MFDAHAVIDPAPHEVKQLCIKGMQTPLVEGGGIFVNSDCDTAAFFYNSSAAQLTAPCLQAVERSRLNPAC
jgi:hypothetical protein